MAEGGGGDGGKQELCLGHVKSYSLLDISVSDDVNRAVGVQSL